MSNATISSPFQHMSPPAWADGFGQDEYGDYASFSVSTGDRYWDVVTQKMRWIPPGTFLMGSPDTEPERRNSEGPQHEVTISSGFWLGDTACTQALWKAVMGTDPSEFKHPDSPVEQVSWDDVEQFFETLRSQFSGPYLQLPTEAQWEYACRAGTTTPFHTGETITTDQANFDGNYPYQSGDKGEYREKTMPVKSFRPNSWGLYEMHGNIWEWCRDWWDEKYYDNSTAVNPVGPDRGSARVLRGGGWSNYARSVRSAYRYWDPPGQSLQRSGLPLHEFSQSRKDRRASEC